MSSGFFQLFGVPILHGRAFSEDEDRPGGARVVLLSYEFWGRQFGNNPQVIGKALTLGQDSYTVIGILSRGFDTEQFGQLPDAWVPFQIDPDTPEHGSFCFVAARLKEGVTPARAISQLEPVAEEYRQKFPGYTKRFGFMVQPLRDAMVSDVRFSLLVLSGAVIFVFMIACSNATNLLLVRAEGRRREIAIRAAIGGGPRRIIRQLLTESVLLSLAGGAFGLGLGLFGIRSLLKFYPSAPLVAALNPINLPRVGSRINPCGRLANRYLHRSSLPVDRHLVRDPAGAASFPSGSQCAVERGYWPFRNWPAREQDSHAARCQRDDPRRPDVCWSGFVDSNLCLVRSVNPGFDAHNVLTMEMSLTATRFEKTAEMDRLVRDGVERISALPGVDAVSAACCLPLETVWQLPFIIAGRPLNGLSHGYAGWTFISPQYFAAFRVPVLRGRAFTERDNQQAPRVVIINQAMAHLLIPRGDPLKEQLIIGRGMRPEYEKDFARQIIGVAGDMRDQSLNRNPRPAMYVPIAQLPDEINIVNLRLLPVAWFIRTSVEPHSLSVPIQTSCAKQAAIFHWRVSGPWTTSRAVPSRARVSVCCS